MQDLKEINKRFNHKVGGVAVLWGVQKVKKRFGPR